MTRSGQRPRAQSMVEYIIIVGLIAVGLIAVVSVTNQGSYGYAVDEAIQGTTGRLHATGGAMRGSDAAAGVLDGSMTRVGTTSRGFTVYQDPVTNAKVISSGDTYLPGVHGDLP